MKFRIQIERAGILGPAPHYQKRLFLLAKLLEGEIAVGDVLWLPMKSGKNAIVPVHDIESYNHVVSSLRAGVASELISIFSIGTLIDPAMIRLGTVAGDDIGHDDGSASS